MLDSAGKSALIRKVAKRYPSHRTFIETGTACADQPAALVSDFAEIISIEAAADYHLSSVNRMRGHPHVRLIHGDSAVELRGVLATVGPSVIFLDAHEIVEVGLSALRAEMGHLARCETRHVVMVDDVRLCCEERGWVSRAELEGWCAVRGYTMSVRDDVAILEPQ